MTHEWGAPVHRGSSSGWYCDMCGVWKVMRDEIEPGNWRHIWIEYYRGRKKLPSQLPPPCHGGAHG